MIDLLKPTKKAKTAANLVFVILCCSKQKQQTTKSTFADKMRRWCGLIFLHQLFFLMGPQPLSSRVFMHGFMKCDTTRQLATSPVNLANSTNQHLRYFDCRIHQLTDTASHHGISAARLLVPNHVLPFLFDLSAPVLALTPCVGGFALGGLQLELQRADRLAGFAGQGLDAAPDRVAGPKSGQGVGF